MLNDENNNIWEINESNTITEIEKGKSLLFHNVIQNTLNNKLLFINIVTLDALQDNNKKKKTTLTTSSYNNNNSKKLKEVILNSNPKKLSEVSFKKRLI